MKAFIVAILVFLLTVGGIIAYEIAISKCSVEINNIIEEISSDIKNEDSKNASKNARKLENKWDGLQNLLMAFNDHKEITEMSQAIQSLKAYCDYGDYQEMKEKLNNFDLLFNYAVKSSKPTIANIF